MNVRCFVAIRVPDDVRDALDRALQDLRATFDVAWTRSDGWHVTLAFCGDVADDRLDDVVEAVRTVASRRCDESALWLTLGGAREFGRAVVLAVSDHPADTVADLAHGVQAGLVSAGVPVVRRRVRPHVTLARRRGAVDTDLVGAVDDALEQARWPAQGPSWVPTEVGVWRSTLGEGPARHDVLASVSLVD